MERFQVVEEEIKVLTVTVLRGRGITLGFSDNFDTPDPYVELRVSTSPNAKQQTTSKRNDKNPEWNETFTFYLNAEKKNTLELIIMDDDFGFEDDTIGRQTVELDDLPIDEEKNMEIKFKTETVLDVKLQVTYDESRELRFSYDLCDEEKKFISTRREKIFRKISNVLKEGQMPDSVDEVPIIAIMGSGGGYRAMCGLSGVFTALQETGILDCATYVTGLSGSSWYISTLFSHEGWPNAIGCEDFAKELRKKFNSNITNHFDTKFFETMSKKRSSGQPVALTDLFGMVIGDALLDNKSSKLSDQVQKVQYGEAPLPICTGSRVWEDVSATEFCEWVEFSPFEFGLAKYGVFGKTADFGAKFYKGRLVKKFDEVPLSYLQGIWGSAFTILLNRVVGGEANGEKSEEGELELAHKELTNDGTHRVKDEVDGSEDERKNELEEGADDEINQSFGSWLEQALKEENILDSRMGKAATVLNVCRGLKFKSEKNNELMVHDYGEKKTMCVVDSGLAYGSPYPTLVRKERKVDLILSFDLSDRAGGDNALPFKEILEAEKWARANNLPFPPVAANPAIKDTNIRECYVFEDPDDPRCPTILHFVLINKTFKDYVAPGVPRETQKEKDFANFAILDDPEKPYSSFEFYYDNQTFDRLYELMKFNTLLNVDLIKEKIASEVLFRQNIKETPVC